MATHLLIPISDIEKLEKYYESLIHKAHNPATINGKLGMIKDLKSFKQISLSDVAIPAQDEAGLWDEVELYFRKIFGIKPYKEKSELYTELKSKYEIKRKQ